MADHLPVHEVAAVIDRNSGKVMETAGDQIVVFSSSAYARVGIHAFDDRVGVALGLQAPRNSRHHAEC
jgi:hypothetical protein